MGSGEEVYAAVREFSVSIVPKRYGEKTLPAIEVSWWDTGADEQRIASVPASYPA